MNQKRQPGGRQGQQFHSDQMQDLIGKASQAIGTTPQQLKDQIDGGRLDDIVRKLPPQQAKSFQELLKDPEKAKQLMETPQAKMLMKKLFHSK